MRIFFRYLLLELIKPFGFCLLATVALWIIVDLFSSLDDFISHGANFGLILKFYGAQIPKMLEMTLPMSILFASLYTIIRLARHSELTALQAGGMSPMVMFSPFLILALGATAVLFVVMAWPATQSEAIREEILADLRSSPNQRGIENRLTFVDKEKNRIWYIKLLKTRSGEAVDVEVLQRGPDGNDVEKYFSSYAEYKNGFWTLHNVKHFTFDEENRVLEQTKHQTIELPGYTISPLQLAYTISDPKQLTLTQLWQFINDSGGADAERLAPFRTQFWYLFAYPTIIFVLIIFAIAMGAEHDRRAGAAAGVFNAIFVLLGFYFTMGFFETMGWGNRMNPVAAAWAGPVAFGLVGILMLSWRFGWLWHLQRLIHGRIAGLGWVPGFQSEGAADRDTLSTSARDLRLKSLKILLDKVTRQNPAYPGDEAKDAKPDASSEKQDAEKESKADDTKEVKGAETSDKAKDEPASGEAPTDAKKEDKS